jgi:hypothetical protein
MYGRSIPLNPGEHACHLYRSFDEQKALILPFFKEGLAGNEHCAYITNDRPVDEWYFELQASGVDVQRERDRGALQIIERSVWRTAGEFNAIVKAREALGMIEGLLMKFSGVRVAGDAAWALNPELPVDQLCHWETTANLVYENQNVRAICEYNLDQHSPAGIHTALRTHAIVVKDGEVFRNHLYEAPRLLENEPEFYHSNADAATVEAMLDGLRRDQP